MQSLPCASPLKQRVYGGSPSVHFDPAGLHMGELQIILGPMFSGKTTELLRRVRRYEIAGKRCGVIKYALDTRYDEECASTHDRLTMPAIAARDLMSINPEQYKELDVLAIDEGQFFPDVVEFCERQANSGKIVLVAALDATFERKPFGPILELIPIAENIVKLNAVCMACGKDASFTKRLGNDRRIEVIGGAEKYLSTCRKHFHENIINTPDIKKKRKEREAATMAAAEKKRKENTNTTPATVFEKAEAINPIVEVEKSEC